MIKHVQKTGDTYTCCRCDLVDEIGVRFNEGGGQTDRHFGIYVGATTSSSGL